jgi:hypothetical protein
MVDRTAAIATFTTSVVRRNWPAVNGCGVCGMKKSIIVLPFSLFSFALV